MLTDSQKADLHAAIVKYVAQHGGDTSGLREILNVDETNLQPVDLEQKWTALVRLQRRIIDLEQQNQRLQHELKDAHAALKSQEAQLSAQTSNNPKTSAKNSLANWLPKWPPALTLRGHRSRVTALSFHPQWSLLASCDDSSEIKVWDFQQGELERTLRSHTRAVNDVCFSPHSQLLVSCSADLSIKVFNPSQEFANIKTLVGHEHTVSAVCCLAAHGTNVKREYIASASRDKTVRLWELDSGFPVAVLRGHSDWVRCLSFSNESSSPVLISSGSDRTIRLYELFNTSDSSVSDTPLNVYEGGHTHVIECCELAPPASAPFLSRHLGPGEAVQNDVNCKVNVFFATAGRDSQICIWSSQCSRPILRLQGHENWVQKVKFHPNGRFLVSVSDDKTMRLWDLATAKLVRTIDAHEHFVTSMAWRGKHLATASVDTTVRLW